MSGWQSVQRLAGGTLVIVATVALTARAQSGAAWRQTFPSRIVAYDYTPLGSLKVQLKSGVIVIDPETGKQLWSRPDVVASDLVPGMPVILAKTSAGGAILDLRSGNELWQVSTLGLSAVKGVVRLPGRDFMLVYGETAESPYVFVAAQYETGKVLWKQAIPYSGKRSKTVAGQSIGYTYDTDHTIVLDPEDDGLVRLDLDSGTIIWRIAERALDSGSTRLDLVAGDGTVFGSYGRKVLAVSLEDGKVLWTHKDNFPVPVSEMRSTPEGVLVRGAYYIDQNSRKHWHPYLALLDSATGATKWDTEKTGFQGRSEVRLESTTILIGLKEGLGRYDLVSGKTLSTVKLPEFPGGEDPCCLERFDDGRLLMWSSQNLCMLDRSDQPLYSIYLKAPGSSFLAKVAAAVALVADEGLNQRTHYRAPGTLDPHLLSVLTARSKATLDAERYIHILTEDNGFGGARFAVVRIDKETGKETGRVWFPDRSPSFKVDPATGIVVVVDDSTLYALRFDPIATAQ